MTDYDKLGIQMSPPPPDLIKETDLEQFMEARGLDSGAISRVTAPFQVVQAQTSSTLTYTNANVGTINDTATLVNFSLLVPGTIFCSAFMLTDVTDPELGNAVGIPTFNIDGTALTLSYYAISSQPIFFSTVLSAGTHSSMLALSAYTPGGTFSVSLFDRINSVYIFNNLKLT